MSLSPAKFWNAVQDVVSAGVAKVAPVRGTVTAIPANGLVQLQRLGNTQADTEQYARIAGFGFQAGQDVICLQHQGRLIPIGLLQNAAPSAFTLDAGLTITGGLVTTGAITAATGVNSPVADFQTQSSPDTASSTDTANLVDVAHAAFTLPTGTWTVRCIGGVSMIHSASGTARVAVNVAGVDGALKIPPTLSSTVYSTGVAHDIFSGVASGSVTYKLRARPNTAGTLTFQNPWLFFFAQRSS